MMVSVKGMFFEKKTLRFHVYICSKKGLINRKILDKQVNNESTHHKLAIQSYAK